MMHIQRMSELLQNIAAGLNALAPPREPGKPPRDVPIGAIQVTFYAGPLGEAYTFGLAQALDVLACDLTWDERGNWSDADRATVEVI